MEYNTSLPQLVYPDFGRHIQKMVDHACTIEDREERNKAAHTIVSIMANLNPQFRDSSIEVRQKLWDQIAIISDFKLDVDYPFSPPKKEELFIKPEKLKNPQAYIRYKHYGKNLELMIQAVIKMEESEEKEYLVELIANHMKRSYLAWNRDSVNDIIIFNDLKDLSNDKIKIKEDLKLKETKDLIFKAVTTNTNNKNYKKGRKGPRK